tara:strand:+ start:7921 stop:8964 length:1044 start_codon:yes stop_codon:yes gene_type:complete
MANYTYGDSINENISQARADKLARDLQNQKLQQDALMETQRQALSIKKSEISHLQNKELTYEQRIERNIDREWHGNFKADITRLMMDFDKYKLDRYNKQDMEKFMLGNLYKQDIIEQGFQNELSRMDFAVDKEIELKKKMIPVEIEKVNKMWETQIPQLEKLLEIDDHKAYRNAIISERLVEKQWEMTKDSPAYKAETAKSNLITNMLEKQIGSEKWAELHLNDKPSISSLLTKHGFEDDPTNLAPGNWTSANTNAILLTLKEYRPWIESLAKNDPLGEKNTVVWDHYRAEMSMLDNSLRGAGWGSLMSWFRSFYSKAGKDTQQANEIMQAIQRILDTKKTAITQPQ